MNRAEAAARVQKLRAMTVDRGATPNEAAVAARKAAALEAQFGPVQAAAPPRRAPGRGPDFTAGPFGAASVGDWAFNVKTGQASSNVKVHRWNSVSDWHIEIDL